MLSGPLGVALKRVSPLGVLLAEPVLVGGRRFALQPGAILPKPYFWTSAAKFGEQCYRLEGRAGDNNGPSDAGKIRVGLDGYLDPFVNQRTKLNEIIFWVYPEEGTIHSANGDFWHAFELHAKSKDGDAVNSTGPLTISTQWSNAAQATRLRVIRRWLIDDPTVNSGSYGETVEFDTGVYSERKKYKFRVQFREHPTFGQLKVWLSIDDAAEVQLVSYYGAFGYGDREHYPQFRSYGTERPKIITTYGGQSFSEYDLPLVTDEGFVDPGSWTLAGGAIGATAISGGSLNIASSGSGGDQTSGFHIRAALTTIDSKLQPGNYRLSYQIVSRSTGSLSAGAGGPGTNLYTYQQKEGTAQFTTGVKAFDFTVPDGTAYYVGLMGRGSAAVNMVVDNFIVTKLP